MGVEQGLGTYWSDIHDTERLILGKACSWLFGAVYHCHSFPEWTRLSCERANPELLMTSLKVPNHHASL